MGIGACPVHARHDPYWHVRVRAIGSVATETSVGGLIFPIMLNHLLNHPKVNLRRVLEPVVFLVFGSLVVGVGFMYPRLGTGLTKFAVVPNKRAVHDEVESWMYYCSWGFPSK